MKKRSAKSATSKKAKPDTAKEAKQHSAPSFDEVMSRIVRVKPLPKEK